MLILGSHVKFQRNSQIMGSLEEALSYNANTFMFYTGAPQNTYRGHIDLEKVKEAKRKMEDLGLDYSKVVVHAPYIVNIANDKDPDKYEFSISFLKQEIKRCEELEVYNMVLHPGSHVGLGVERGIQNIKKALNEILKDSKVTILLETMAGKGTEVGSRIDEMKSIIDGLEDKSHIGDEIDEKIGLDYVGCVHINDSKNIRESHKDRHENFGFGSIGFDSLLKIVYNKRLESIPKILETPYVDREYPPYKYEIEMIHNKKFNENLMENIKNGK